MGLLFVILLFVCFLVYFGMDWCLGIYIWFVMVLLCVFGNRKCNGDVVIYLFSLLIYEFKLVFIINIYDCNVFIRVVSLWVIFLLFIV